MNRTVPVYCSYAILARPSIMSMQPGAAYINSMINDRGTGALSLVLVPIFSQYSSQLNLVVPSLHPRLFRETCTHADLHALALACSAGAPKLLSIKPCMRRACPALVDACAIARLLAPRNVTTRTRFGAGVRMLPPRMASLRVPIHRYLTLTSFLTCVFVVPSLRVPSITLR